MIVKTIVHGLEAFSLAISRDPDITQWVIVQRANPAGRARPRPRRARRASERGASGNDEMRMRKLGDDLLRSMAQALAHAHARRTGSRVRKFAIDSSDIQKARKTLGLSQDEFADAFGVSASTLRKWEQGQRTPTGAAKTLLRIIQREPKAVIRALKAT
jgi:putative transcriptional regulator